MFKIRTMTLILVSCMLLRLSSGSVAQATYFIIDESNARIKLNRYYNKVMQFSILLPESWEQYENIEGVVIAASSDKADINIVVKNIPSHVGLDEFFNVNLSKLQQLLPNIRLLARGNSVISNHKAKWIKYSLLTEKGDLEIIAYMLLISEKAYVITCSASPNDFLQFKLLFEEIAKSFKHEKE